MPYSQRKKVVYVWIPKTAGTSMANAFKKRKVFERNGQEGLWGRIAEEDDRSKYQAANWQHITALDTIKLIGQQEWDRCFTFTILRNPYDRLVSFYEFSKSARKDPKSVQFGKPDPGTFEEWLEAERPPSQLHFLTDGGGNILVDYLGRFETLDSDVFKICLKMRIWPIKLPKLNTSARRNYQAYYTPEIKSRVEELYGAEIERFRYKF